MAHSLFMPCSFVGTGMIALWAFVRFPGLRPERLVGAIVHVFLSFAAFNAAPLLVHWSIASFASPYNVVIVMVAIVIPGLTYILLSWVWLIDRIRDLGSSGPDRGHLADARS